MRGWAYWDKRKEALTWTQELCSVMQLTTVVPEARTGPAGWKCHGTDLAQREEGLPKNESCDTVFLYETFPGR